MSRLAAALQDRATAEAEIVVALRTEYPVGSQIKWIGTHGEVTSGTVWLHDPTSDRIQVRNDKTKKGHYIRAFRIVP